MKFQNVAGFLSFAAADYGFMNPRVSSGHLQLKFPIKDFNLFIFFLQMFALTSGSPMFQKQDKDDDDGDDDDDDDDDDDEEEEEEKEEGEEEE